MDYLQEILTTVATVIDIIGILILIFGFTKMLIRYLAIEIKHPKKTPIKQLHVIRGEIVVYTLLALDFLIASDIILTVTELNQDQLIQLSVMIVFRIAIGYFLGKEVAEIEKSKKE